MDALSRTFKISKSAVGKYVGLASTAGLDARLVRELSDEALQARLYRPVSARVSRRREPDFAVVHQELKRPGVTLPLLWEEYARDNPKAYKYTSFCVKYRAFKQAQARSMR